MSLRSEQCKKVCRILDDVLANRPTERDSLIVAVQKAFEVLETAGTEPHWIPTSKERPPQHQEIWITSGWGNVEIVCGRNGIWLIDKGYYTEPEIIAWMPANVPSPYQPEEE